MDYLIDGMYCGACAARIERNLGKLAQGQPVSVNFATKKARVPDGVTEAQVLAAVEKLGYSARALAPEAPPPDDAPQLAEEKRRFMIAGALTLPVFVLGMAHGVHIPGSGIVQLVLTTLVLAFPGRGFFVRAFHLSRAGAVNMDTLVTLGVGAAYGVSVLALVEGRHEYYFESAAVIVALVLLGRWLEERARHGSAAAVRRLHEMGARAARLVMADGREEEVPVASLRIGDKVAVRPGEKVPLDGEVESGSSVVDEALVTGEPIPPTRGPGSPVIGATTNVGKERLVIRVTRTGKDTVLARIVSLVEDAQASKAQVQRLADRVSLVFVPAILVIALGTFLVWWLALGAAPLEALLPAVAVLVIACPCALGLATPTAILAGTGRAAESLILMRSAPGLERAGKLDILVADKTGTLTEGHPAVSEMKVAAGFDDMALLGRLAAAESASQHPLAMAIVSHAEEKEAPRAQLVKSTEHVGRGIETVVAQGQREYTLLVGSQRLLSERGIELPLEWRDESNDPRGRIYAAEDGKAAALVIVEDRIRAAAPAALAALHKLGVKVVMATGDRPETAHAVAKALGVDEVRAGLLPADKVALIEELRKGGKAVAMVGDGLNDAPALAAADVGIAVGSGADVALDAADVVIPHGDLAKVVEAIYISRRTMRVVRQNLAWAFLYNVLAVPVAAAGQLSPMLAAGAMAFSSVSVVLNALRLRKKEVT